MRQRMEIIINSLSLSLEFGKIFFVYNYCNPYVAEFPLKGKNKVSVFGGNVVFEETWNSFIR